MRFLIYLLLLTSNFTLLAQSTSYSGLYEANFITKNAEIKYKLTLNPDGTFFFHSYSNHTMKLNPEENLYGKGIWNSKKNIISFITDIQKDLDERHTLNFSNSKARIDRKSPRNKSNENIPDKMRFYDSNIPWIKALKLTKISQ